MVAMSRIMKALHAGRDISGHILSWFQQLVPALQ